MEHLLYIQKKFNDENTNFKVFRDMIIKDLISLPPNITSYEICTANKNKKGRKKPTNVSDSSHFQENIPIPPGYKRKKHYKNCLYCYSLNIKRRRQTYLQCKQCVVPLCPGKCFEMYHSSK